MGHFRELAPHRVSFVAQQVAGAALPEAKQRLAGSRYKIENVTHMFGAALADKATWESARKALSETIKVAQALSAQSIYMLTGGRGSLTWEEAAEAFSEAIAPCRDEAKAAGIALMIEPAPVVYADMHIAHNLRDTTLLAEIADIGICLDIFPVWTEADLKATIKRAGPRVGMVQLGDYILGDRSLPCRAVVGEGVIPMKQIFGWILDTGFSGAFDLEMIGPRIDKIGPVEALRRSAEKTGEILRALGV